jgi:hypothetical protein
MIGFVMTVDQGNELFQMADAQRSCPRCEAVPRLVRQILDSRTGKTVRMFECKCRGYSWSE